MSDQEHDLRENELLGLESLAYVVNYWQRESFERAVEHYV